MGSGGGGGGSTTDGNYGGGGGGGGAGGGSIILRAFEGITITATGSVLAQGAGGGQFGAPTFTSFFGGGGAGGGIILDSCSTITINGTVDNRGRAGNTLGVGNGGTLKLFYQDGVISPGSVQTGRLFDAGLDSSGQVCNAPPGVPDIITPLDEDTSVKQSSGDVFILFAWTPTTDPEGGPVTYTIEIAKDGGFTDIEKVVTGIGDSEAVQVLTISGLPVTKYWHVKAVDAQGQDSDFSKSAFFRMTLDDGINHGGGDCNISAGVAPGALIPGIFAAVLMAFGLARRRR
jgi:hypothetical protein